MVQETGLALVIMAAGESRRFGGLKQLEGFGPQGQTILDYTIFDGIRSGVGRVVLVISEEHGDQFARQVVRPWAPQVEVRLVAQRLEDLPVIPFNGAGPAARSRPWGTGHAVWAAREEVKGSFILANADDFYGRGAIAAVAAHLHSGNVGEQWALQAYALGETLPDEGGCNRGFCRVDEDGFLLDIKEELDVRRESASDLDQWVSMNLWGLEVGVFGLLEDGFQDFLAGSGHDPEREFFLPHALAAGIARKKCRIQVLPPTDHWLGVTHPEDADRVRRHLAHLHHEGVYPEDLHT